MAKSKDVCFGQKETAPEDFVGFATELQVKPAQFSIVSTNNKMVSGRVHVHG